MSPALNSETVYAAGAILWRMDGEKPKVLLIHRNRHDDYSFPKGKVDPGETLPETAVREIREETGYAVTLGAPLGMIEYVLPSGRNKEVHYWTAQVDDTEFARRRFEPNDEVDEQRWLGLKKAAKLLTYSRDRELLELLRQRINAGTARTFAVIALRHAQAVPPLSWPGSDDSRPLTSRGQEQADLVVPILLAFGPQQLVSSSAVRCLATLGPLSRTLRLTPLSVRALAQSAQPEDGTVDAVVGDAVTTGRSVVLCSHSPVMPEVVRAVARRCEFAASCASALGRCAMLSTGEFTVLHLSRDTATPQLVWVESHGPHI